MEKLGNSLKKIVLAGIGATAVTVEKSQEVLKDLVDKGELTVEQGKVLNEELKHNVKEKVKNVGKKAEVAQILEGMSEEQIAQLKELLDSFKKPADVDAEDVTVEDVEDEEAKTEDAAAEEEPAENE
jgi:polyhydroxyalkanoate synthesis regulator phasin